MEMTSTDLTVQTITVLRVLSFHHVISHTEADTSCQYHNQVLPAVSFASMNHAGRQEGFLPFPGSVDIHFYFYLLLSFE